MNIVKSIWNYKCPRCRKGNLFTKPFVLSKPLNMNQRCSECNLNFEPEPGYYFGAMFISYIWTGWIFLFIIGFCMLVLDWGINASFGLLIAIVALTYFWIARISRSMYIHLDVKYDPDTVTNNKVEKQ